jgi:hypothetical protein
MNVHGEDLPQHGVVLIPPSAPEFQGLVAEIRGRLDHPVAGSPPALPHARLAADQTPAAILVNQAPQGIASIFQVWTFAEPDGRTPTRSIGGGINSSVLLPFGLDDRLLKLYGYWHVILPGSKRIVTLDGDLQGDNSDVRPPAPDEMWTGGIMGGFGGGNRARSLENVTLTLDGVFFADGGFAGPNRGRLWEQTVFAAEASTEAATLARRLHDQGVPAARILDEIRTALGSPGDSPGPPPPPRLGSWTSEQYRQWTREAVWQRIGMTRTHSGDDRALYVVLGWQDARVPNFRKL